MPHWATQIRSSHVEEVIVHPHNPRIAVAAQVDSLDVSWRMRIAPGGSAPILPPSIKMFCRRLAPVPYHQSPAHGSISLLACVLGHISELLWKVAQAAEPAAAHEDGSPKTMSVSNHGL